VVLELRRRAVRSLSLVLLVPLFFSVLLWRLQAFVLLAKNAQLQRNPSIPWTKPHLSVSLLEVYVGYITVVPVLPPSRAILHHWQTGVVWEQMKLGIRVLPTFMHLTFLTGMMAWYTAAAHHSANMTRTVDTVAFPNSTLTRR
jgi:hypothetical protein